MEVYQGRFKGILVDKESYLPGVGKVRCAESVSCANGKKLSGWHWISFKSMIGKSAVPEWLEADWILSHFGEDRKRAVTRFIAFVGDGKGLRPAWDSKIHPVNLGDEVFVESIYKQHVDQAIKNVQKVDRLERRCRGKCLASYFDEVGERSTGM